MDNITQEIMTFNTPRPEAGDYIEFTPETQNHYGVSWYCSKVISIKYDGGFRVGYDNEATTYYIGDFEPPYFSSAYNNKIFRVKI